MHITIIADPIDNQRAGVHQYSKRLIENLLKIDKKNSYSFIHEKENPFFHGRNHHVIPRKNIPGYGSYRKFFLIPRKIKELKPDVVWELCHIGPFAIPKNIKRVTTIHDLTPILLPKFHIKRSTLVHRLLLKYILRQTDLIFVSSENTKKDLNSYYKKNLPINVIPLGVDLPQRTSKKINFPTPYILYLGTIEPRKNIEILLSAFLELKKLNHLKHKLIIAGEEGWKIDDLMEKIKSAKKEMPNEIFLTGYLSEDKKAELYSHADIFIYPSVYEGFGLPPLEALSYGIPLICSSGGSLKEIFKNVSLMFDPKDKDELKSHILNLLSNPELKQILSTKGRVFAQNFDWQITAEKSLEALEKLKETI